MSEQGVTFQQLLEALRSFEQDRRSDLKEIREFVGDHVEKLEELAARQERTVAAQAAQLRVHEERWQAYFRLHGKHALSAQVVPSADDGFSLKMSKQTVGLLVIIVTFATQLLEIVGGAIFRMVKAVVTQQ